MIYEKIQIKLVEPFKKKENIRVFKTRHTRQVSVLFMQIVQVLFL